MLIANGDGIQEIENYKKLIFRICAHSIAYLNFYLENEYLVHCFSLLLLVVDSCLYPIIHNKQI